MAASHPETKRHLKKEPASHASEIEAAAHSNIACCSEAKQPLRAAALPARRGANERRAAIEKGARWVRGFFGLPRQGACSELPHRALCRARAFRALSARRPPAAIFPRAGVCACVRAGGRALLALLDPMVRPLPVQRSLGTCRCHLRGHNTTHSVCHSHYVYACYMYFEEYNFPFRPVPISTSAVITTPPPSLPRLKRRGQPCVLRTRS